MNKPPEHRNALGEQARGQRRRRPAVPDANTADMDYLAAVTAHVEKTVGPCGQALQGRSRDQAQVDILLIDPDQQRPWHTLVTCGMGSKPMTPPPGREDDARLEMALCLPPNWPPLVGQGTWEPGPGAWIANALAAAAKLPFMFNLFFTEGSAIPNGDPPEPLTRGTDLCCSLLTRPRRIGNPSFSRLTLPDGSCVQFLSVVMLHREEMNFKLRRGYGALMKKLEKNEVDELLILDRPSVCRGGLLGFLGF